MIKITVPELKKILSAGSYVNEADLEKIKDNSNFYVFTEKLLSNELISKSLLGQAVAEHYKVNYLDLSKVQPKREEVLKLPEEVARKYHAILVEKNNTSVVVATDDPDQPGFLDALKELFFRKDINLNFSLTEDIESLFIHYLKPLDTRFAQIIESKKRVAPEIFDQVLVDAMAYKASDIHIEPHAKEVVVRFRIDGVLHEAGRIPKEYYENILNRIKIQAKLRIDEHFSPQDGAIQHVVDEHTIAMRVSVVPTLDGEKIVIRILSEYIKSFSMEDLGLSHKDQQTLIESSRKPFGMILVTGPTGSGKTTTLYALLNLINNPGLNVTTIEDPVEYKMLSVNQIQVDTKTNLTFASGLRSILRQDPDIILVGEIRDKDTAEISVNAALTGHLLFSTFHANDASTAIPRLLDIGVEPFLVASTMELIISQRLVRRICSFCKISKSVDDVALKNLFSGFGKYFHKGDTIYEGKGCDHCRGTKYLGRVGIFEFIRMTKEMKELVLKNPSSAQIWDLARSQGAQCFLKTV